MKEGHKYSRKQHTIVWNSTQSIQQICSVIQVFDPVSKEMKYFRFAANPDVKQSSEDARNGLTPALGKGKDARVKFVVPVTPLPDRDGEFKEIVGADKNLKVVRISEDHNENDPMAMVFRRSITRTNWKGNKYETSKYYEIMDYKGQSLYSLLKFCKEKTAMKPESLSADVYLLLNLKQYLQLCCNIIDELNSCHKSRRLHKDFTGGNILISKKQGQIAVVLIDEASQTIWPEDAKDPEKPKRFEIERLCDLKDLGKQLYQCLANFKSINGNHPILEPLFKHFDILRDCNDYTKLDPTQPPTEKLMATTITLYKEALSATEELLSDTATQPEQGHLYAAIADDPVLPALVDSGASLTSSLSSSLFSSPALAAENSVAVEGGEASSSSTAIPNNEPESSLSGNFCSLLTNPSSSSSQVREAASSSAATARPAASNLSPS